MSDLPEPVVYQLKIVLQGISPMIWRRLLVKSDSTSEDLHNTLQIAMGWEDIHLHYFTIHGQKYGVWKPGGIDFNTDASAIKLGQFDFREKEKFLDEYDLSANPVIGVWRYWWRHQIRVEGIFPIKPNQTYSFCTGGQGICPPEDCGGAWEFMKFQDEFSLLDVLDFITFGRFFIGQIVDLFLIPSMVQERNNYLSGSTNKELEGDTHPMQKLLKAAKDNGNVLSLGQAILMTNLLPNDVQELLTDALRQGLAEIDNEPDSGAIRYHFDL